MILLSADFFSKLILSKNLSGTLSERQMLWIQIRSEILSILIRVKTVCKVYQQMTKVATCKERVKMRAMSYSQFLKLFKNTKDSGKQEGQVALNPSHEFCLKLTYRYMLKAGHVPCDTWVGPILPTGA